MSFGVIKTKGVNIANFIPRAEGGEIIQQIHYYVNQS